MGIDKRKRVFLKTMIASSLFPFAGIGDAHAKSAESVSSIKIIIPKDYMPSLDPPDQYRLIRATLTFIQEKYRGRNLPIWGKKFEDIHLEKRLVQIVNEIGQAIRKHMAIYPVDPVWIVAQMMIESFFYEFTISSALAVGLCQFVRPTAHEFGMRCAGDLPEHGQSPYRLREFASALDHYYKLRDEKRQYRNQHRPEKLGWDQCLQIIAENRCLDNREKARKYLAYKTKIKQLDQQMAQSRLNYKTYIQANVKGRSIFSPEDIRFLDQFDQRLTYKSIWAMVKMMAQHLRARNGNILAATAGYHAGLSRTKDIGFYKAYGKMPNIQSTVDYLSHIIVVHHEITNRLHRL